MDDNTFKIKTLEFHIKQTATNYDKCLSSVVKQYTESDIDFETLVKPCANIKQNLEKLFSQYETLNSKIE